MYSKIQKTSDFIVSEYDKNINCRENELSIILPEYEKSENCENCENYENHENHENSQNNERKIFAFDTAIYMRLLGRNMMSIGKSISENEKV